MAATVVRRTDNRLRHFPRDAMLEAEGAIRAALNDAGGAATEEARRRFDAEAGRSNSAR